MHMNKFYTRKSHSLTHSRAHTHIYPLSISTDFRIIFILVFVMLFQMNYIDVKMLTMIFQITKQTE